MSFELNPNLFVCIVPEMPTNKKGWALIKGWYYLRNPNIRISQKPLDRRRAEWKSSERIRFVKVKSTPYLMVEFNLSKWNFRFQSTKLHIFCAADTSNL